ncbi:hypothetical protein EPI10_002138 [Gossypium australe]|uniref:Uncharacterized protein n=1 Tax=Gossypium australe TaxID=47621 RepID=A0A5B6VDP1_9ROSI|nr:hypothetical protein EPI10_002138 [Gossypium australe]
MGHSIENYTALKKLIERFIKMGIVRFDDPSGPNVARNPLPSHSDQEDSKEVPKGVMRCCEFHVKEGHEIRECTEFRAFVQSLMDNKELEFFEDVKSSEGRDIYASEERSTKKFYKVNHPVMIISWLRNNETGTQAAQRVIIQKPVASSYKGSKRVPWNYDCNVMIPREDNSVGTSEEG